jgi:hypothetical protein
MAARLLTFDRARFLRPIRLRMRKFFLIAICALPLLAAAAPQQPPISPNEMVHRAIDAYMSDDARQGGYNYSQREDVRILDSSGNIKRQDLRTFNIAFIEGSPYRRLLQRDDKPLPAGEEREQEQNFRRGIEERRGENADQRRARIAEWERKRQERRGDMREVPNAFDFRVAGQDVIDGVPVWILEGLPRPGYKPQCKSAGYFNKIKGRIWITKSDYRVVKLEAETLDTICIGAFFLRIAQGGHIAVDFSRIADGIWAPSHASIVGSARILLIKGYRLDADYTFSNYTRARQFSTTALN